MGETRYAYRILKGKSLENCHLGYRGDERITLRERELGN
jgi:hypothetical protein